MPIATVDISIGKKYTTLKSCSLRPPRCSSTASAIATGSWMAIERMTMMMLLPSALQNTASPTSLLQLARPTKVRCAVMPFHSKKLSCTDDRIGQTIKTVRNAKAGRRNSVVVIDCSESQRRPAGCLLAISRVAVVMGSLQSVAKGGRGRLP